MIAENPENPLNLVAGGLYQYPSAINNTSAYYGSGVSGAFTSWDGGRHWGAQTLPANPNWFNKSSPICNQLHLADTAIGFGPNSTVYYIDLSDAIGNVVGCSVPTASLGLYGTVSTDGGITWGTPVPIRGTTAGAFFDKPWIAVDPTTGEAYVAYNDDTNGTIDLQNSTDRGQTWSSPVALAAAGGSPLGIELVVDPSGGVDVAWIDMSSAGIYFVRSTNHGSSFSTPVLVATAITAYSSSSPDSFRSYTLPALGVDAYAGNAYTGDLYVVWQNGTGGSAGSPKVSISVSANNGDSWSAPVRVNSDTHPQDYQPSLAIGPDGTVYVDWYAVNPTTGHYRLAAAVSHNGGSSFDRQFNVSDVDSYPYTKATGLDWWIGDYTHTIADRTGARPLWTDARSPLGWYTAPTPSIWGYVYNISFYTALLVNDSLSASIPTNVSVNGTVPWTGTLTLAPTPTPADWMVGQVYNLSAPPTAAYGGTTYTFAYWYGNTSQESLIYDVANTINGSVVGGEHLAACYVASPGGACQAPGAPGFLDLTVQPANASVTINGVLTPTPIQSTPWAESPGTYWVNVSAPLYYDFSQSYVVSPGNTTTVHVNLTRIHGDLVGTVSPVTASVKLNGSLIAVAANGTFAVSLLPGTYSVSATAPYYYAYTNSSVRIVSGERTQLTVQLAGFPGWINGTVSPVSAVLQVNGVGVPVGPDGSFSLIRAPGTYWLNASKPGWSSATSGPIALAPFGNASVALALIQYLGRIAGIVVPGNASLLLNGSPLAVDQGGFSVDLAPGMYSINASAWTYSPASLSIPVLANVTTPLVILLNLSAGWIQGTVNPGTAAVRLDGQVIPVASDGSFNVSALPGAHRIEGEAPGFSSSTQSVGVNPGRTTFVRLALVELPASGGQVQLIPVLPLALAVAAVLAVVIVLLRRRRRRGGALPR